MSKVVVGMSGGVDSSVAAWLLKQQGHEVIGVTMQIWQDEEQELVEEKGGCCGLQAVEDARRVAWQLGIPYYVMNFKKEFKTHVMDYFTDEYIRGRTPNPCIACNRYVKWEALLERSLKIGAEYIAFCPEKVSSIWKRSDVCFVQSYPGAAVLHFDASRCIYKRPDSADGKRPGTFGGRQGGQSGNLFYSRSGLCGIYPAGKKAGTRAREFCGFKREGFRTS